jgi:hypothetical protein
MEPNGSLTPLRACAPHGSSPAAGTNEPAASTGVGGALTACGTPLEEAPVSGGSAPMRWGIGEGTGTGEAVVTLAVVGIAETGADIAAGGAAVIFFSTSSSVPECNPAEKGTSLGAAGAGAATSRGIVIEGGAFHG